MQKNPFKFMSRKKLDSFTETKILTKSRRRCCLCTGLYGDYSEKKGQIAHLDKNNSNNNIENLCWLCFDHHSQYDSTTSQHKNYTKQEVKEYRNTLYFDLENQDYEKIEISKNSVTKPYSLFFNGMNAFLEYSSRRLSDTKHLILEINFKIHNQYIAGVLLNVMNTKKSEFLYLVHFSSKHPDKPNQLQLKYMRNNESTMIFSFVENISQWSNLVLNLSEKTISLTLNNKEVIQSNKEFPIDFDKIEIGGTRWENPNYEKDKPTPVYLNSYFQDFRLFENSNLICNLEFSYGEDFFLKNSPPENECVRYGGMSFKKMNN